MASRFTNNLEKLEHNTSVQYATAEFADLSSLGLDSEPILVGAAFNSGTRAVFTRSSKESPDSSVSEQQKLTPEQVSLYNSILPEPTVRCLLGLVGLSLTDKEPTTTMYTSAEIFKYLKAYQNEGSLTAQAIGRRLGRIDGSPNHSILAENAPLVTGDYVNMRSRWTPTQSGVALIKQSNYIDFTKLSKLQDIVKSKILEA